MKGYREKDVVSNAWHAGAKDLEFIENLKRLADNSSIEKIGKFVLFSGKHNQECWVELEAYLEPSRKSTMDLFCERR